MGWMAWDLMRGLDVALARPGADKERVILLGSVAGGGDIAAVTAALDDRFTCVVPFNFGGPQPETKYPLPADADKTFNYVGGGSWESTRNLRNSALSGFLPWTIVASVAPRKVIHAHEFSWDRDRDPVWKRYQKVWGFYNAADGLAFTTGTGVIQGNDPTASHCNNIGSVHRKSIYTALKKWFDIPIPDKDSKERRTADELKCWTAEAIKELKPRALGEVLGEMARDQWIDESVTRRPQDPPPNMDRFGGLVVADHGYLFGFDGQPAIDDITAVGSVRIRKLRFGERLTADARSPQPIRATVLTPTILRTKGPLPAAVCICTNGTSAFVETRSKAIAELLRNDLAVVLVQLHGTGIERPSDARGRTSSFESIHSALEVSGWELRRGHWTNSDWTSRLLKQVAEIDSKRLVLWGEGMASNRGTDLEAGRPHGTTEPTLAEPLPSTIATTLALAGDDRSRFKAVVARGGLLSFRSVFESPFVHVPHDSLPINVFRAGDLPELWTRLAPKPLRLEGLVDGTNRRVTAARLEQTLKPVREAYKKGELVLKEEYSPDAEIAKWIIEQLKK